MDIFGRKKKLISYLSSAFLIVSFCELLAWLLSILPIGFDEFYRVESFLFCIAFGGFSSFYVTNNSKKAITCVLAIAFSSAIFSTYSGYGYSIIACVFFGICFSLILERMNAIYGALTVLMIASIIGAIFGSMYDLLFELLKSICYSISGKGALFGAINDLYSVLFSNSFSDLFYYFDYSSAQLIDGKIVSGVINIFSAGDSSKLVAKYLTAKYFVNISLAIGAFVFLFSRFKDSERLPLIFVFMLSVIAGDSRMMSAMLMLYNPFLYLGYLFCIFMSYFASRFIDIRIGFTDSASIVELFRYCNSWVYFIITGIVLSILTYFVLQLVVSKFDFDKRRLLPRDARRIVLALGGERNIERLRNGKVYVANPNLIDILKLDCDIHGNEITLIQNDLDVLQEYF